MRIFLLLGLTAVLGVYLWTIWMGRRVTGMNGSVADHRTSARRTRMAMILYVVCIETCVNLKGGARHDTLFWWHLAFALSAFVSVLLLNGKLNGESWRKYHAVFAYGSGLLFSGMFGTGLYMILTRF